MSNVSAFVFDAYGTLFDVQSVTATAEAIAPRQGGVLSQIWRTKQLEYSWLQSIMLSPSTPRDDFRALTAKALDYALSQLMIQADEAARTRLVDAWLGLTAFPDAADALAHLAPRPRWILSNGTRAMLEPMVAQSSIAAHVDGILSVDDAGVYKPSPRVYQLAVDRLRLAPAAIGFVSANGWDAAGAKAFGFTTFWINRNGLPVERHAAAPDFVLNSLAELAALEV
ncbi:MAG TPA: haloacid dehalogenase type II [Casimicrobiaceae bacterium]